MTREEQILQKLDHLTAEVAALKDAVHGQQPPAAAGLPQVAHAELMEQVAASGDNLAKWVKSLDRLMELKEDLVPLGRPMLEEVIQSLDQATHGIDTGALKELVRQFSLNLPHLAEAIRMVGGLVDLKNDSNQIVKDAFEDIVTRLAVLQQKGFFDAMRQVIQAMELVGQRMLAMDPAGAQPVRGLLGLHAAMRRKEVQEGLGIALEMVSALSVLKKG